MKILKMKMEGRWWGEEDEWMMEELRGGGGGGGWRGRMILKIAYGKWKEFLMKEKWETVVKIVLLLKHHNGLWRWC